MGKSYNMSRCTGVRPAEKALLGTLHLDVLLSSEEFLLNALVVMPAYECRFLQYQVPDNPQAERPSPVPINNKHLGCAIDRSSIPKLIPVVQANSSIESIFGER